MFRAKQEENYERIERMVMLKILNNIPATQISKQFNLKGYHNVLSAACASENIAIGEGFNAI